MAEPKLKAKTKVGRTAERINRAIFDVDVAKKAVTRPSAKSIGGAATEVAGMTPFGRITRGAKGVGLAIKAAKASNPAKGLAVKQFGDLVQPAIGQYVGKQDAERGGGSSAAIKKRTSALVSRVKSLKAKVM